MSLINVTGLTFSYDGSYDNIFENVSFQLDTLWKLGFTGRNGRGKTTFLKLLMGKYEYTGTITSSVDFDYFPYEICDKTKTTIEIVEDILGEYQNWELLRELKLLAVSEDILYRPFNTLSNGEQTKLLLAVLFLKPNNFLLIDEPTNHLDSDARNIVGKYLNSKSGFILVSHDRNLLDSCVDHILSINKANIELQNGNFSSWYYNKQLQDEFELAQNEKLQKDITRLNTAAKKTRTWSDKVEATKIGTHQADRGAVGHKAAKMMKRSKAIVNRQEAALEQKSKLLKNTESNETLLIRQLAYHSNKLVELVDVSICYEEKIVCENVNFSVAQGDRICIRGKNGCGKSSVLKLILGNDIKHTGVVKVASGLVISYVSQDTSFLSGNLRDFALQNDIDDTLFRTILRKFSFDRVQFEKNIQDYSEGQKKKVLLAKSICDKAHLYVWDEPLNFIDVLSRMQIEDLILRSNLTMLFVEHDTIFCEKVANDIVNM